MPRLKYFVPFCHVTAVQWYRVLDGLKKRVADSFSNSFILTVQFHTVPKLFLKLFECICWVIFHGFFAICLFSFSILTYKKKTFRKTIRVSNSLHQDGTDLLSDIKGY